SWQSDARRDAANLRENRDFEWTLPGERERETSPERRLHRDARRREAGGTRPGPADRGVPQAPRTPFPRSLLASTHTARADSHRRARRASRTEKAFASGRSAEFPKSRATCDDPLAPEVHASSDIFIETQRDSPGPDFIRGDLDC